MTDISRLDVHVTSVPRPGLIRSRIESALAGRPTAPGPEQTIGQAVADAVAGVTVRAAAEPGPGDGEGAPD